MTSPPKVRWTSPDYGSAGWLAYLGGAHRWNQACSSTLLHGPFWKYITRSPIGSRSLFGSWGSKKAASGLNWPTNIASSPSATIVTGVSPVGTPPANPAHKARHTLGITYSTMRWWTPISEAIGGGGDAGIGSLGRNLC